MGFRKKGETLPRRRTRFSKVEICWYYLNRLLSVVDGYLNNNRKLKRDTDLPKRRAKFCIRKV
uniref:Uncharacterized protein n=1 Tax=Romanomermis culicivorax TaxID=13658 RepID=A0A915KFK5_ROMCU